MINPLGSVGKRYLLFRQSMRRGQQCSSPTRQRCQGSGESCAVPAVGEAMPTIIELLKDSDPNVRQNAKLKLAKSAAVVMNCDRR